MAQYNIELRTESRVWETVSIASDNLKALRIELAQFVGALLRDHADQIWIDQEWRIDVTDGKGLILYSMQIDATDSPATMSLRR